VCSSDLESLEAAPKGRSHWVSKIISIFFDTECMRFHRRETAGGNTGWTPRGDPGILDFRRDGKAQKVINLGRGGELEGARPGHSLATLWSAVPGLACAPGMKHLRDWLLGASPANGEQTLMRKSPREGRGSLPSLTHDATITGIRRGQGPGAELVGTAARQRLTGAWYVTPSGTVRHVNGAEPTNEVNCRRAR